MADSRVVNLGQMADSDLFDWVRDWCVGYDEDFRSSEPKKLFLTKIKAQSLAKLLNDIDRYCLAKITTFDLYDFGWITTKDKFTVHDIPAINVWLQEADLMKQLFAAQVVIPRRAVERAEVISHIVRIAYYLLKLRNLNSARILVAALDCASVFRLRETWKIFKGIDKNKFRLLESLWQTFNYRNDWQRYKNVLAGMIAGDERPCIPFFGYILHEAITMQYREIYVSGASSGSNDDNQRLSIIKTWIGSRAKGDEGLKNPHILYHRQRLDSRSKRKSNFMRRIQLPLRLTNKEPKLRSQPNAIVSAVVGFLQCKRFASYYTDNIDRFNPLFKDLIESCPIYNEFDLFLLSNTRE